MADNDDDDHKTHSDRIARKVRAPEYQRNPTAPSTKSSAEVLPRRRPPPPEPVSAPKRPLFNDGEYGATSEISSGKTEGDAAENEVTESEDKRGYGHPPKHSRFKKGQSGNPRGRPKNARSLKTYLLKVLDEVVEVNEQGRIRKMTKREVIARQTVQQAMKGNLKSLAVITAFDPVEDELPEREKQLSNHEAAMLAHYLGLSNDNQEDGQ